MSFEAPVGTKEPTQFTAGDTVKWTRAVNGAQPADGTLQYFWNNPIANQSIDPLLCTDNGDGTFLATLTPAMTDAMTVGDWKWEAFFYPTDTDDRYKVSYGRSCVKANYASLSGGAGVDDRSHVEKTLSNIEAVIQGKANQDQMMYMINGRQLQRMTFTELEKFRKDYRRQLAQQRQNERAANGQNPGNTVKIKFGGRNGGPDGQAEWPWNWPWRNRG